MELYLLDKQLNTIGILDDFESLIWRRKYYGCGEFSLYCNPSDYPLLSKAKYIYRRDRDDLGMLDSSDLNSKSYSVRGMFLKHLMSRSVMYPTIQINDTLEDALCQQVLERLKISSAPSLTSNAIQTQVTGGTLLDWAEKICKEKELSCDIRYDYIENQQYFCVWKGKDRTQSQSANPWAVFSAKWETLTDFEYSTSERDYKNYAIVAGEGNGSDRQVVIIDACHQGEDRRELWVDAKDFQREENITDEQYVQMLKQRGFEKLAEYKKIESFSADVNTGQNNLVYLKDYDLGDLVTFLVEDYDIAVESRITEIEEIYESGKEEIKLTFGQGYLLTEQYIKRELT